MPTPPIYFPDDKPPGVWGGAGEPMPTPPIALPPNLPPALPEGPQIKWKVGWTPLTGWVVVGIPEGTIPVPSKNTAGG